MPSSPTAPHRFELTAGTSLLAVEARSNVGRITFATDALTGHVEATVTTEGIDVERGVEGTVCIDLRTLVSGNALYDAELQRRIDARRHPTAELSLTHVVGAGLAQRYRVNGKLRFHGIDQDLAGTVSTAVRDDTLIVSGEHTLDIRDFDLAAPAMLMLKIYPDVRVLLQLEATRNG